MRMKYLQSAAAAAAIVFIAGAQSAQGQETCMPQIVEAESCAYGPVVVPRYGGTPQPNVRYQFCVWQGGILRETQTRSDTPPPPWPVAYSTVYSCSNCEEEITSQIGQSYYNMHCP